MKLQRWLDRRGLSHAQFAEWVRADRTRVYRWCQQGELPGIEHMVSIYRATRGAVDPRDFYPLPRLRPQDGSEAETAEPVEAE